ncbi:MAG: menaquinone biosynthesis protein [Acidobacteria bacterium]|nr:menaquinone biosynthesis protein [Acidobacteriota bacterium]
MRISAISYLNTAPLMWDFEHGLVDPVFQISYTIPSECARELEKGTADIGIIPSAAYASIPNLLVLPDVAIASRHKVRSILLVSSKPISEIRTVALDSSSLTSAALTRILFEKYWGGKRRFTTAMPDLENMLVESDAALLIGDPALAVDRSRYYTCDLAEEWLRFTGKPFVFAFWAVREEAARSSPLDLARIFRESRDHGLEPGNLRQIVTKWADKLNLADEELDEYLTANICFHLDEFCLEGLRLFYRYAHECKVLPAVPEVNFTARSPALV